MLRLCQIAAYKVFLNRGFWLIISLYTLVFLLLLGGIVAIGSFPVGETDIGVSDFFRRPQVWVNILTMGQIGTYLLATLIIQLISSDFSVKWLRQEIMSGFSREQSIVCHAIMGAILALVSTLILFVLGFLVSKGSPFMDTRGVMGLMAFFLASWCYFGFATLVVHLIQSSATSLFIFYFWIIIIEPSIRYIANNKIYQGINQYFPFYVIPELIPSPSLSQFMGSTGEDFQPFIIGLASFYLLSFYFLCWVRLKYKDL